MWPMSTTAEILLYTEQSQAARLGNESPTILLLSHIPSTVEWLIAPEDFTNIIEIYGMFPEDAQKTDLRLGNHFFALNRENNSIQRVDLYELDYPDVPTRLKRYVPESAISKLFKVEINSTMCIHPSEIKYDQTVTWTVPVRSDVLMYAAKLEVFVDLNGNNHTVELFVPKQDEFSPQLDYNHDWESLYSSNFSGSNHRRGLDILGYYVGKRNFDKHVELQISHILKSIELPAESLHNALGGNSVG